MAKFMGFSLTSPAPEKCDPTAKNRVWGFFGDAPKTSRSNRPQSLQPRRENRPTTTKVASGRTYWPSRDPIEEQGGINLYGMVGNDAVGKWDYLGRFEMDGMHVPRDGGSSSPVPNSTERGKPQENSDPVEQAEEDELAGLEEHEGRGITGNNFGPERHTNWVSLKAKCPFGHIVAGVEIDYSDVRTCLKKWVGFAGEGYDPPEVLGGLMSVEDENCNNLAVTVKGFMRTRLVADREPFRAYRAFTGAPPLKTIRQCYFKTKIRYKCRPCKCADYNGELIAEY